MNRRQITTRFLTPLLVTVLVAGTSCSRMGMNQKMAAIMGSAGVGGAAVGGYGQAEAASTIAWAAAAGLLAGGSTSMVHVGQATPEQARRAKANASEIYSKMPEEKKAKLKAKNVRHIAVDTRKREDSRGARVVMLYDLEKEEVLTKTYEVRFQPEIGQQLQFGTLMTEYVGGSGAPDEIARPDGSENLR